MSTAFELVNQLRVGRVTVTATPADPMSIAFPMGAEPCGQSGFGAESGREGFEVYTRLQAVELNI